MLIWLCARYHHKQLRPADRFCVAGICSSVGHGTVFRHGRRLDCTDHKRRSDGWRLSVCHAGFCGARPIDQHTKMAVDRFVAPPNRHYSARMEFPSASQQRRECSLRKVCGRPLSFLSVSCERAGVADTGIRRLVDCQRLQLCQLHVGAAVRRAVVFWFAGHAVAVLSSSRNSAIKSAFQHAYFDGKKSRMETSRASASREMFTKEIFRSPRSTLLT